jgi:hypothetical protein
MISLNKLQTSPKKAINVDKNSTDSKIPSEITLKFRNLNTGIKRRVPITHKNMLQSYFVPHSKYTQSNTSSPCSFGCELARGLP